MWGVKTKLQAFLTSEPDGDELSDSTPIPLYPRTNTSGNHWLARVPSEPQNQSDVASNFCYSENTVRARWSQRWCCRFESWSMLSRLDRKLPTFLRHYDPSKLRQTTQQSIWSAISEYLTILWSGQSRPRAICEHVEGVINSHKILVGKNGMLGRYRSKRVRCHHTKWIRLTR